MNNNIVSQDKNQHKIIQDAGQAIVHSKYKNIIFDLGAVLLHFNPKALLKDLFGLSNDEVFDILKCISDPVWLDMDRGIFSPEQVAEKLAGKFGKENMIKYLYEMSDRLKPIPQGVEILNQVRRKGYKTYILSNLSEFCYIKIKDFDFIKNFDGAIYSYQHKCAKPDEKIYQTLLNLYSLRPEECLFIDDLEVNIIGSKALGIDGIVCKDHNYVLDQLKFLKVL